MAYFSNGCEGEVLDAQCAECPVGKPDIGCPVALVQMLYNYDQLDERGEPNKLAELMNVLINEDGECQMRKSILQAASEAAAEERMRNG